MTDSNGPHTYLIVIFRDPVPSICFRTWLPTLEVSIMQSHAAVVEAYNLDWLSLPSE